MLYLGRLFLDRQRAPGPRVDSEIAVVEKALREGHEPAAPSMH